MTDPMDLETRARFLAAGWQPPQPNYDKWRLALAAYYMANECPAMSEAVRNGRALNASDRETIRALAAAAPFMPGPPIVLVPADAPDADATEPGRIVRVVR